MCSVRISRLQRSSFRGVRGERAGQRAILFSVSDMPCGQHGPGRHPPDFSRSEGVHCHCSPERRRFLGMCGQAGYRVPAESIPTPRARAEAVGRAIMSGGETKTSVGVVWDLGSTTTEAEQR